MKEVEKLLKKAKKLIGDPDAKYFWGVEYSYDSKPDYRARLHVTKEGCQPLVVGGKSEQELIDQLKDFLKKKDHDSLAVQFLKHEVDVHVQAIHYNEKLIEKYQKKNEDTRS